MRDEPDGEPISDRWLVAACVGMALVWPALALVAYSRWGLPVSATVVLCGFGVLAGVAAVAVRRREASLRELALREQLESARRSAVGIAGATLSASDTLTAEHSEAVAELCEGLCGEFEIEGEERERVLIAARLHDIGKVAVPPEILNKPGPLDDEEWAVITGHTVVGEQILAAVPELWGAAPLVRHSHERWDGSGYPDGLAEEEIPLGSRVVFCADAFHAIRSDRPYRRGRAPGAALAELKANAGTQFDPDVVDALERYQCRLAATAPASSR